MDFPKYESSYFIRGIRKTTQKLTLPALLQKRPRDASSQSGSAASLKTPGETMPRPRPPLRPLPMAPMANCMGVLAKDQKMTPIRPLYHYFLQLGRNGLRKHTFATVPKPHGMIPIFRSNVSDVLIEEPMHERHVVDFLRNTEWGSGTVSIYAQICFPVNCQHICAYFATYLPTYLAHIPNFIHMFHMFYTIFTYLFVGEFSTHVPDMFPEFR